MPNTTRLRADHPWGALLLALGLLLSAVGCGDDDATTGTDDMGPSPMDAATDLGDMADGGDDPDAGPPPPAFAVCGFTIGPDGLTGLVDVLPSIDDDAVFDPSTAIEFGGRPICATDGEALYLSDPEAPNITRFTLGDDGRLVEGDTVSFMRFGTGPLSGIQVDLMQFISPEKAYFVDVAQAQVIIWNPTAMTTIGSIALDIETPEGLVPAGIGGITRRGDQLILPFSYGRESGVNSDTTSFAFVDLTTDAFTVETVTGCGALQTSMTDEAGDTYLASNAVSAIGFRVGLEDAFPPCVVRIRAGASSVDRTFDLELNSLVGGSMSASLLQGPGSSGFLTAYDETVVPIEGIDPARLIATPAWRLHRVDGPGTATTATRVLGVPLGAGRIGSIVVDGRTLIWVPNAEFSETTAYDITNATDSVAAIEALTAPAVLYAAVRLR